jgi:hypothetical protein
MGTVFGFDQRLQKTLCSFIYNWEEQRLGGMIPYLSPPPFDFETLVFGLEPDITVGLHHVVVQIRGRSYPQAQRSYLPASKRGISGGGLLF